jgi:hypothetical protein
VGHRRAFAGASASAQESIMQTESDQYTAIEPSIITLPAAILLQDTVMIDEQENHVVLTLRLPIDLIRDNHATLMALCEIATGKSMPLAEPEKGDLDDAE